MKITSSLFLRVEAVTLEDQFQFLRSEKRTRLSIKNDFLGSSRLLGARLIAKNKIGKGVSDIIHTTADKLDFHFIAQETA